MEEKLKKTPVNWNWQEDWPNTINEEVEEDDIIDAPTAETPTVEKTEEEPKVLEMTPERRAAADAFWKDAKDRIIDIDNFHKAFDPDFDEKVMALFDYSPRAISIPMGSWSKSRTVDDFKGILKDKRSWGVIKTLDPSLESTKAIKKLYNLQFYDMWGQPIVSFSHRRMRTGINRERAESNNLSLYRQMNDRVRELSDKAPIKEYCELTDKEFPPTLVGFIPFFAISGSKGEYVFDPHWSRHDAYGHHEDIPYDVETGTPTAEEMAEYGNKVNKEILDNLKKQLAEHPAWWHGVMKWINRRGGNNVGTGRDIECFFVNKENQVQKMELSYKPHKIEDFEEKMSKNNITPDADLVLVRFSYWQDDHSVYHDTSYNEYVSMSDKATADIVKEAGIKLDYKGGELDWGHSSGYSELTHSDAAVRSRNDFLVIEGMDRWFEYGSVHYATD